MKEKKSRSFNLSSDERKWLTQFFEDMMLWEGGIYTLWGSKPLSMIAVECYSDAEKKAFNEALTEEEKKEATLCMGYNLDKSWFQWEKIQPLFPMNRYLLLKIDQFEEKHVQEDRFFLFYLWMC